MTNAINQELLDAAYEALNAIDLVARFAPRTGVEGSPVSLYDCAQQSRAIILEAIKKAEDAKEAA